jgi:DNA-binding MarR family transcriptional regulator
MDTTDILIKIRRIVRSINMESKKIQKEYGVSIPQVLCLGFLKSTPDYQATQSQIKEFLNLNSSTVSGIISRLEKKACIARLPKKGDKRLVYLALTQEGDELLSSVPNLLHERLSDKLENVGDDELNQLESALNKLIDLLEIRHLEASPILVNDIDLAE